MSDSNKKRPNDESTGELKYTYDPDTDGAREIPSISRLLNRKKLNLSKSSTQPSFRPILGSKNLKDPFEKQDLEIAPIEPNEPNEKNPETAPAPEPAAKKDPAPLHSSGEPREISISFDTPSDTANEQPIVTSSQEAPVPVSVSAPSPGPPPSEAKVTRSSVAPARRKSDRVQNKRPLIHWTREMIQSTKDPLGKGLLTLLPHGASDALFLSIQPPEPGKKLPVFNATAVYGDSLKQFWNGLQWDPSLFPHIWNSLIQNGLFAFPAENDNAPSGGSPLKGSHNIIRSAFGAKSNLHLILFRIGPLESSRGILAILSSSDLSMVIPKALEYFTLSTRRSEKPGSSDQSNAA